MTTTLRAGVRAYTFTDDEMRHIMAALKVRVYEDDEVPTLDATVTPITQGEAWRQIEDALANRTFIHVLNARFLARLSHGAILSRMYPSPLDPNVLVVFDLLCTLSGLTDEHITIE